jgi:hypothetical protein
MPETRGMVKRVDETHFWVSESGTREDIENARLESAVGALHSADETLSRYVGRSR